MKIQVNTQSTSRNQKDNCAPIGNENKILNSTNSRNEDKILHFETRDNINDSPNINNSQNQNVNQRQDVYSRCFKVLCMIIECIFCIAFIVFEKVIKEKDYFFDAHYLNMIFYNLIIFKHLYMGNI